MLRVIVIITVALFSYGTAQQYTSCQDLPKIDVTAEVIKTVITTSPCKYNFATPVLRCGTKVFTNPPRGDSSVSLFALLTKRTDLTVFKALVDVNNKKNMDSTICQSGVKQIWHFSEVDNTDAGMFYCVYTCNGTAIQEFGCANNNRNAFQDKEKAFVQKIRTIPYGNNVLPSDDCYTNTNCPYFN